MKIFIMILMLSIMPATLLAQNYKSVGEDVSNEIVSIDFKRLDVKSNKIICEVCFQNPTGRCIKPTKEFEVTYGSQSTKFKPDKICIPEGYCKITIKAADVKKPCDVNELLTVKANEGKQQVKSSIKWSSRFQCPPPGSK